MSEFIVGLDLGQASDYTGLIVLERIAAEPVAYHLRHIERPTLGTPYPAIVARVKTLTEAQPLAGHYTLIVDATGVGAAVIDLLRAARLRMVPVTITGGDTATRSGDGWRTPKRDLVAAVLTLLQTNRLKIAESLALGPVLVAELLNFKVKIDPQTAHDSYSAWREGDHDDLVLAVALACWWAERCPSLPASVPDPQLTQALRFHGNERRHTGGIDLTRDPVTGRVRYIYR